MQKRETMSDESKIILALILTVGAILGGCLIYSHLNPSHIMNEVHAEDCWCQK